MSGGIRQCAHGHLSLDAANWVCPWCELARLEGLILDWDDAIPGATSTRYAAERVARTDAALKVEARLIRAQREESTVDLEYMKTVEQAARDGKLGIQRAQREEEQHRKHPTGDYCVWCHSQWPCEESSEEGR